MRQGALHVALDRDEAAELRRVTACSARSGSRRVAAAAALPRARAGPHPGLQRRRGRAGEAAVDPRALTRRCWRPRGRGGRGADRGGGRRGADRRRAARSGCEPAAARSCAPPRSCSPPAPVRAGMAARGARPPVRPMKGEVVELRAAGGERPCERIVVSERVYIVPRAEEAGHRRDGRGAGASTPRSPPAASTSCCARPIGRCPRSPSWSWSRCGRAAARDARQPAADRAGALDGLVVASGHHRNGVLLAPITAARDLAGELPTVLGDRAASRRWRA